MENRVDTAGKLSWPVPGQMPSSFPPLTPEQEAAQEQLAEAMAQMGQASARPPTPTRPMLASFTNHELIHEMLERGYVVMKAPADGGFPEVLR